MKRILNLVIPMAMLLVAATASAGEGHAMAQCTNDAQACVNKIATKAAAHGWMGVEGDVDAETGYFVLSAVTENGPAAKAGLKPGYAITAVNGKTVNFKDEAAAEATMAMMLPHAELNFTIDVGHGKSKDVAVTLLEMPESEIAKRLGHHMLAHVDVAENSSR